MAVSRRDFLRGGRRGGKTAALEPRVQHQAADAGMGRRSFLAVFLASTAGLLVGDFDPSRLEWFLPRELQAQVAAAIANPPPVGTLLVGAEPLALPEVNLSYLARETLRQLRNALALDLDLERRPFNLLPNMRHVGDLGQLPRPRPFVPYADYGDLADVTYDLVPVYANHRLVVDFAVSAREMFRLRKSTPDHRLGELQKGIIAPMAYQLAREIRHKKLDTFGELDLPYGGEACRVTDAKSGISLRVMRHYDCEFDAQHMRVDILGGRS
jgi:hypothetical protein